MAAGYEVLGEPTSIVTGLTNLGKSIRNRRDTETALGIKKEQLEQQRQQQQNRAATQGIGEINRDYAFSKFATGDTGLDKVLAPKLDEIRQKSLDMMMNGNIQEGMMYAGTAAQQLGQIHTLASNAIKSANNSIMALQKQDPNIDVNKLRADVNKQISSQFLNPDGTLADRNQLQSVNIPDDLAGQLASTGNYYSSAAPAVAFFSDKKNMTPFEYGSHNGLGGGQTIKGASSIYKPIHQDANGNYVPTTVTEDVNIGEGHTAQVMPDELYENLPLPVKGGITYSYNKMVSDPKSALYTSPNSPLFGMEPSSAQHPQSVDLAKRWVARNIADQVSPSYVNRNQQANRIFASQLKGEGGSGSDGNGDTYYNAFQDIKDKVTGYGDKVTLNNFNPAVQKYASDILKASGAVDDQGYELSNDQAAITRNPETGRYELVDNATGTLIAPLNEVETNLSSNSKAAKTTKAILEGSQNKPVPRKKLTQEEIKKGLNHLMKRDDRPDLTYLYD